MKLPDNAAKRPQDKYNIDKVAIGTGAFGTVRKATLKSGKQEVALKTMKKDSVNDKAAFANELELSAFMDHPNITNLYETFEDWLNIYLVMEICYGGEMFDKIYEEGSFSEREASYLLRQILSAVYYMHSNNIAHRDLKPENFLLTEDKVPIMQNTLKVIDFGIAKRYTPGVPMKTMVGTVYYVAPEVFTKSYDEKCDVWSAGVILYILLCGGPPFGGRDDKEIIKEARHCILNFDLPEFANVSSDVKNLITSMIRLSSSKRLSARDAFETEWVQGNSVRTNTLKVADLVSNLQKFSANNRFKKAAMSVVAHRLDHQRIKSMRECFLQLDTNGDGKLSREELQGACSQSGITQEEVAALFDAVDTDKSGSIGYNEFLAPMLEIQQHMDAEACWQAFAVFDSNGDGSISAQELHDTLRELEGSVLTQAEIAKIISEHDSDGDGSISFEEFKSMMEDKTKM
jgi:calcium-dependent protein kinase